MLLLSVFLYCVRSNPHFLEGPRFGIRPMSCSSALIDFCISGYCIFSATVLLFELSVALWTWPSEAAAFASFSSENVSWIVVGS